MRGQWLRKPQSGVAVLFVHGVLSDADGCWRAANGVWWPKLLSEEADFAQAGIYVFTYKTGVLSRSYRLGDAVDALKEHMRLDGLFDCHTLVFVCHSMGGLVVRKLIVERREDFRDCGIAIGLFLVASPSLGSRYANMLEPLIRIVGHTQADALRFSKSNAWLLDLDKEFKNLKEGRTLRMAGKELIEDVSLVLPRLVDKPIVEPFSGAAYFGEPYKLPDSDHSTIAKPDGPEAIQHRLLLEFIKDMPPAARRAPPAEDELRSRLEARVRACRDVDVPYRTFHRLAALFSMSSRFCRECFDVGARGRTGDIEHWLAEAILKQLQTEKGLGGREPTVEEDLEALGATELARREKAKQVDERHLLLALLANRRSGTMAAIEAALDEAGLDRIEAAARARRPAQALRGRSDLPSLPQEASS